MMEILYRLYRLLLEHQLKPENVKITIEFLDFETQQRAEYALRMSNAPTGPVPPNGIMDICAGRPLKVYGMNLQVKLYEEPRRVMRHPKGCMCLLCDR